MPSACEPDRESSRFPAIRKTLQSADALKAWLVGTLLCHEQQSRLTFAELLFLVAGVIGIYVLLRPFQQWLEGVLVRTLSGGRPRGRRTPIDVTDFRSYPSPKKEDEEHEDHGS